MQLEQHTFITDLKKKQSKIKLNFHLCGVELNETLLIVNLFCYLYNSTTCISKSAMSIQNLPQDCCHVVIRKRQSETESKNKTIITYDSTVTFCLVHTKLPALKLKNID